MSAPTDEDVMSLLGIGTPVWAKAQSGDKAAQFSMSLWLKCLSGVVTVMVARGAPCTRELMNKVLKVAEVRIRPALTVVIERHSEHGKAPNCPCLDGFDVTLKELGRSIAREVLGERPS